MQEQDTGQCPDPSSDLGLLTEHEVTRTSDVSVVILTKNSEATLERCVSSVASQKPREIIAVDSQSTDLTLKILEDRDIKILRDTSNSLGFKRQLGVEAARGRLVMFVDSDVELAPCCIARLRYDLITNQWAGAHARLLSLRNISYWQKSVDIELSRVFNRPGPKKHIGTAAALFRRGVLLDHPFDPEFRESSEDVDLSRRLVENGFELGTSTAVAYHNHPQEFLRFAKQRFRYGLGDARFWLKYREGYTIFRPLMTAVSYSLRKHRVRLIPYLLIGGVIQFLGVLIGFSRKHNLCKLSISDLPYSNGGANVYLRPEYLGFEADDKLPEPQ